jgi:uncharacterized coiled-coil DUF342 family protein
MASQTTQQIGIGNLSDHIRKLWPRLTRVEAQTSDNTEAITDLREQAQSVEQDIATLKSMADTADAETADQVRQVAELKNRMEKIEAQLAAKERAMGDMARQIRGEQIKRGKAAARADRAEEILAGKRSRTRR